jgi:hypothetical protein
MPSAPHHELAVTAAARVIKLDGLWRNEATRSPDREKKVATASMPAKRHRRRLTLDAN